MRAAADAAIALPVPRRLILGLTIGVAGTVLFTIIYLIEGVTRPGYDGWPMCGAKSSQAACVQPGIPSFVALKGWG